MRAQTLIAGAAALLAVAGCVPSTRYVEGGQHLALETEGRRQWSIDADVDGPGYRIGLAEDGSLASVSGVADFVDERERRVRVSLEVGRVEAMLHGVVRVTELTTSTEVLGVVEQPVPPGDTGAGERLELVGTTANVYDWQVVPGRVTVVLTSSGTPTTTSTPDTSTTSTSTSSTSTTSSTSSTTTSTTTTTVVGEPVCEPTAPAVGCSVRHRVEQRIVAGTSVTIPVPAPLDGVGPIVVSGATGGVSVVGESAEIEVSAVASASGSRSIEVTATGCIADDCSHDSSLQIDLTVVPLEAAGHTTPVDVVDPSPDRLAAGSTNAYGATVLADELAVLLGTDAEPGNRAMADAVARIVGAVVVGGIPELGVFQLRWAEPVDLSQARATLDSLFVRSMDSNWGGLEQQSTRPDDWDDDGVEVTWPFDMIGAPSAWDVARGSEVVVGIIDGGEALAKHEDLDVMSHNGSPNTHATHVAGLACARANGKGVVGVAWGCPVISRSIGRGGNLTVMDAVIEALFAGSKVINISLGPGTATCYDGATAKSIAVAGRPEMPAWERLYKGLGEDAVFTIAAGNQCVEGPLSSFGQAANYANTLVVGALNSDGSVARFSNVEQGTCIPNCGSGTLGHVDIYAPGGVRVSSAGEGDGLWSTVPNACGVAGWCSTYGAMAGTSQAAPIVAGVAALVRSRHPRFSASEVGRCVTRTGGQFQAVRSPYPARFTPIEPMTQLWTHKVNAVAAVNCLPLESPTHRPIVVTPTGLKSAGMTITIAPGEGCGVSSNPDLPSDTVFTRAEVYFFQSFRNGAPNGGNQHATSKTLGVDQQGRWDAFDYVLEVDVGTTGSWYFGATCYDQFGRAVVTQSSTFSIP